MSKPGRSLRPAPPPRPSLLLLRRLPHPQEHRPLGTRSAAEPRPPGPVELSLLQLVSPAPCALEVSQIPDPSKGMVGGILLEAGRAPGGGSGSGGSRPDSARVKGYFPSLRLPLQRDSQDPSRRCLGRNNAQSARAWPERPIEGYSVRTTGRLHGPGGPWLRFRLSWRRARGTERETTQAQMGCQQEACRQDLPLAQPNPWRKSTSRAPQACNQQGPGLPGQDWPWREPHRSGLRRTCLPSVGGQERTDGGVDNASSCRGLPGAEGSCGPTWPQRGKRWGARSVPSRARLSPPHPGGTQHSLSAGESTRLRWRKHRTGQNSSARGGPPFQCQDVRFSHSQTVMESRAGIDPPHLCRHRAGPPRARRHFTSMNPSAARKELGSELLSENLRSRNKKVPATKMAERESRGLKENPQNTLRKLGIGTPDSGRRLGTWHWQPRARRGSEAPDSGRKGTEKPYAPIHVYSMPD